MVKKDTPPLITSKDTVPTRVQLAKYRYMWLTTRRPILLNVLGIAYVATLRCNQRCQTNIFPS